MLRAIAMLILEEVAGHSIFLEHYILEYIWLWNELLLGLIFLQSDEIKTMAVGVATILKRFSFNQPLMQTRHSS